MTNHNQDLMSSNTNVIVSIGILYETLMDIAQSYQPLADNIHYDDIKIKAVSNIIDGLITNLLNQAISDQGGWPLNGALNPPGKQDYNYNAGLSQMIALASQELFNGNIEIAGSVIAVVDNRVCEHMAPYIPEPNTTNCVLLCGYHFSLANCVVLNVKQYTNAQEKFLRPIGVIPNAGQFNISWITERPSANYGTWKECLESWVNLVYNKQKTNNQ